MILETNKLINSDFDMLKKLGWMLYNREDQDGGLTKEELNALLHIINENSIDEIYREGYNECLSDNVQI